MANPTNKFSFDKTWAGTLYQWGRPLYSLAQNASPAGVFSSLAVPTAKYIGNETLIDATTKTVQLVSLLANPFAFALNYSMVYVADNCLENTWEQLTPEQKNTTFYQELFGVIHALKYEGVAKAADWGAKKLNTPKSETGQNESNKPPQVDQNKAPQADPNKIAMDAVKQQITDLFNNGYRIYRHENGHTKGAHMSLASALRLLENGVLLECKNGKSKFWLSKPALVPIPVTPIPPPSKPALATEQPSGLKTDPSLRMAFIGRSPPPPLQNAPQENNDSEDETVSSSESLDEDSDNEDFNDVNLHRHEIPNTPTVETQTRQPQAQVVEEDVACVGPMSTRPPQVSDYLDMALTLHASGLSKKEQRAMQNANRPKI